MITVSPFTAAASSFSLARICLWPMCTPSNVPMVMTAFLNGGRSSMSLCIFIGCKINVQCSMFNVHCSVIFAAIQNFPMSLYSKRGVSAQKEEVHAATKNLDKGLYPKAFCKIYPDVLGGDDNWVNVMH